ncbi:hypothetical protein Pst134EA_030667 [Puccinia striiformis f. sp. tritici]|uniref:hypothetical protein n=1 Tax=Puccinia striiformis f. sp. tritici TaxID=168172 RepID=UPI00200788F9|nr:hypothetical protein Pst134EA_030663 [Puccinia striiformis f. sp. tritici]XP_047797850.1 hypothetical protein Pst134EA_030667 [Puccinia striiformis f. sp. tritici]KAH9446756.1 hypothetical protein Pst134EA_030663 [Puccinia striiformis f. sp. tritici]KAH9446760.1 hypothetical protein Pst134EA_030667 [Puccinia striiformis f. sp. tritici]KAI9602018.1 hypothetical protein KEM48_001309 [Puccinia striiformis f. sp. tritici PST-130]
MPPRKFPPHKTRPEIKIPRPSKGIPSRSTPAKKSLPSASGLDDVPGDQEGPGSIATRLRPRPARQGPLTPTPSALGQGKRKVRIIESDESGDEAAGPSARRQRRGPGPKQLTRCPDDSGHSADLDADFVFTKDSGVGVTAPAVVKFPWGFSIPVSELSRADKHEVHFSQVSESSLKSVLGRIGCSVVGKNRQQLIKLCLAYAPLIQGLPAPTAAIIPSTGSSNDTGESTIQRQGQLPPNTGSQAAGPSAGPFNNPTQTPRGASKTIEIDLIQWSSTGSTARNSAPKQAIFINPSPSGIPSTQQDEIDFIPPSSMPGLTPDVRSGSIDKSDESFSDSETTSDLEDRQHTRMDTDRPPSTRTRRSSPRQKSRGKILRILKLQSQQITTMQEDIASINETQRDINEKLQDVLDRGELSNSRPSRSKGKSTQTDPRTVSRTGQFKKLIERHFQSLFGLPAGASLPPSPPSDREKSRWLRESGDSFGDIVTSENESDSSSSETDVPERAVDPNNKFPYRRQGGPGHPSASQEQLKTMYNMMKAKGMRSFRFDFRLKLGAPENVFCLDLARDIFVALVESDQYQGLKDNEKEPHVIGHHLKNYAREVYEKKVKKKMNWSPRKTAFKTKEQTRNSRTTNLKKLRVEDAVDVGGINEFLPFIKTCCSDDETDDEAPVPPLSPSTSNAPPGKKRRILLA